MDVDTTDIPADLLGDMDTGDTGGIDLAYCQDDRNV